MTPNQKAEINRAIAEKVMGWGKGILVKNGDVPCWKNKDDEFMEFYECEDFFNWPGVGMVLEEMERGGWGVVFTAQFAESPDNDIKFCQFYKCAVAYEKYDSFSQDTFEAILIAALEAVGEDTNKLLEEADEPQT